MIKAQQTILRISTEQATLLKAAQQESARCWNDIVSMSNAHYKATGKWLGKHDIQKMLKGKYQLHSQTIQALADKYAANRETAAELRRNGIRCSYPWRIKKFMTTPFKQMAIKTGTTGTVILTLAAGKRFDTGIVLPLPANTCEILWRKGNYALSWTAEYPEAEPVLSGLSAGIDIGEIHPAAIMASDGSGLIVSGREIRAIKQLRNKSLAWFSRSVSKCKKGSARMKRLVRAKINLKTRSDARIRDLMHQATRKAIDWCAGKGIAELVIGDLTGVEKNTKKKKRLGRMSRQKVSQMEYGRVRQYLRYKAKEAGIKTLGQNEERTTRQCPACGKNNAPRGRLYSCTCGFNSHRDGKAAFMILRKKYPDIALPEKLTIRHVQAFPMYRKRIRPACVDGPDVALSSLVIAQPLCGGILSAV
jgi:putative transposase